MASIRLGQKINPIDELKLSFEDRFIVLSYLKEGEEGDLQWMKTIHFIFHKYKEKGSDFISRFIELNRSIKDKKLTDSTRIQALYKDFFDAEAKTEQKPMSVGAEVLSIDTGLSGAVEGPTTSKERAHQDVQTRLQTGRLFECRDEGRLFDPTPTHVTTVSEITGTPAKRSGFTKFNFNFSAGTSGIGPIKKDEAKPDETKTGEAKTEELKKFVPGS